MKNISLAAQYRPQDFNSIVGQETIKSILKKAAFEEKIAPAYLLSGTRGVGKTTIARVFAKALNCENKEQNKGEPCNTCSRCIAITNGSYVDVIEMDAASNRGVEDTRKLREMVAYAPMEGKFRVVIVDEAHMLTKEAFNSLLKTLEEPPAHTTFVLATTEATKFPITIISRCQHFIFKHVPDAIINANLKSILERENYTFEDEAVEVLTKRAAGSVRDSVSLLSQSLVLVNDKCLTADLTRSVLGIANNDIMERLFNSIAENNTCEVASISQDMMTQAIDITFFMKNLTQIWRSFFLIKQHKAEAIKILNVSEDEGKKLYAQAEKFSTSFIHSAWQMTLDAQQKIIKSLEPPVALELFLINLALLPKLLPLHELRQSFDDTSSNQAEASSTADEKKKLIPSQEEKEESPNSSPKASSSPIEKEEIAKNTSALEENISNAQIDSTPAKKDTPSPQEKIGKAETIAVNHEQINNDTSQNKAMLLDFNIFLDFLKEKEEQDILFSLQHIRGVFSIVNANKNLLLKAPSTINANQLKTNSKKLKELLKDWAKEDIDLEIRVAEPQKNHKDLKAELEKEDIIKEMQSSFNAHIIFCESLNPDFVHAKKK